jgi:hypothetical protein
MKREKIWKKSRIFLKLKKVPTIIKREKQRNKIENY